MQNNHLVIKRYQTIDRYKT